MADTETSLSDGIAEDRRNRAMSFAIEHRKGLGDDTDQLVAAARSIEKFLRGDSPDDVKGTPTPTGQVFTDD